MRSLHHFYTVKIRLTVPHSCEDSTCISRVCNLFSLWALVWFGRSSETLKMLPSKELLEALSMFSHAVLFGSCIKLNPLPLTLMKAHPYQWHLCLCSALCLISDLLSQCRFVPWALRCWLISRSALPFLSDTLGLHSSPCGALALYLLSLILGSHLNFLFRPDTFVPPWQEPLVS